MVQASSLILVVEELVMTTTMAISTIIAILLAISLASRSVD